VKIRSSCAKAKRLGDVGAAPEAAVDEHRHAPADGVEVG
jgi:hypothetical protein